MTPQVKYLPRTRKIRGLVFIFANAIDLLMDTAFKCALTIVWLRVRLFCQNYGIAIFFFDDMSGSPRGLWTSLRKYETFGFKTLFHNRRKEEVSKTIHVVSI